MQSVEEYVGRLWETFPPARFLTRLVSQDQEREPTAASIGWAWVTIEVINGVGKGLVPVAEA